VARRDAGGSRTRFDRFAGGCRTVWLQRRRLSVRAERETTSGTGCPGGVEPTTSTVTTSRAWPLHHGHSTPARSRTRNPSFEARDDVRFTTRARNSRQKAVSSRQGSRSLFCCPLATAFCLLKWTAGESHPDFRLARAASSCSTSSPVEGTQRKNAEKERSLPEVAVLLHSSFIRRSSFV
jgi:hypothetical protein